MSPLTVIAATDLTERSAHVAGRGAMLAQCLDARLILVHVGSGEAPRFLGRNKGDPEADVSEMARAYGADVALLSGDPALELCKLAEQENAALIVLGLHRERRVLDVLRLSTLERIVLAAPCPVLVAHQPPEKEYAQVLAPTDFSAASANSLAVAARIAPDAKFHAVHALQLPIGMIFKRGQKESDAALAFADMRKAAFLAFPGLPKLAEPPEIVPGGVHQILEFRQHELGADLVCIGAHSGRQPNALGNYARDLMRLPPTDLLIAKPA